MRTCSLFSRGLLLIAIKWIYSSFGNPLVNKRLSRGYYQIGTLWWPRKERKEERRTKKTIKLSQVLSPTVWRFLLCFHTAQPHRLSALKPSEIAPSICTGAFRNLTKYLHRDPPEPQHGICTNPSTASPALCTGTLQNFNRYLHPTPAEPHSPGFCTRTSQVPVSQPSRTSPTNKFHQVSAPETFRNLTGTVQNAPQPSGTLQVAPDRTRANLG